MFGGRKTRVLPEKTRESSAARPFWNAHEKSFAKDAFHTDGRKSSYQDLPSMFAITTFCKKLSCCCIWMGKPDKLSIATTRSSGSAACLQGNEGVVSPEEEEEEDGSAVDDEDS